MIRILQNILTISLLKIPWQTTSASEVATYLLSGTKMLLKIPFLILPKQTHFTFNVFKFKLVAFEINK